MEPAMWFEIMALQREIQQSIAASLRALADGAGAGEIMLMLPMAVFFGAVHALTPGHSKSFLAAYVAGSGVSLPRALSTSLVLSLTHVGMAVLIAVLGLQIVSPLLGSAGRSFLLEGLSRGVLLLVGGVMVWHALRPSHGHSEPSALHHSGVGFAAGLIPCPLTLFVMSFALARNVPLAGLSFAAAMWLGVAATLAILALVIALFRDRVNAALAWLGADGQMAARLFEGAGGALLLVLAMVALWPA
jgi:nickel/cobalt exporter